MAFRAPMTALRSPEEVARDGLGINLRVAERELRRAEKRLHDLGEERRLELISEARDRVERVRTPATQQRLEAT